MEVSANKANEAHEIMRLVCFVQTMVLFSLHNNHS